MNQHPRFQITGKQLVFMIIGSIFGTGIVSLIRPISEAAAQDTWMAVLLGALAPLLTIFLIERLGRKFPDHTVVDLVRRLFGKTAGAVLTTGFIVYIIFIEAIALRNFIEITSLSMLPKTPLWAIGLILLIAVVYAASKGAKVLARLNELLFYITLIGIPAFLAPLIRMDITNILPVGTAGFAAVLRGSLVTVFAYAGAEVLFVVYPMVGRKDEVMRAGVLGVGFVALIYFMLSMVCLLVLGVEAMRHLLIPCLTLMKEVDIPVIERLELFSLILMIGWGPRPLCNYTFAAAYSLTQLLSLNIDRHYPAVVAVVGLFIYVLALLPHDIMEVERLANYAGYAYLVVGIGYPLILLVAACVREGKTPDG